MSAYSVPVGKSEAPERKMGDLQSLVRSIETEIQLIREVRQKLEEQVSRLDFEPDSDMEKGVNTPTAPPQTLIQELRELHSFVQYERGKLNNISNRLDQLI